MPEEPSELLQVQALEQRSEQLPEPTSWVREPQPLVPDNHKLERREHRKPVHKPQEHHTLEQHKVQELRKPEHMPLGHHTLARIRVQHIRKALEHHRLVRHSLRRNRHSLRRRTVWRADRHRRRILRSRSHKLVREHIRTKVQELRKPEPPHNSLQQERHKPEPPHNNRQLGHHKLEPPHNSLQQERHKLVRIRMAQEHRRLVQRRSLRHSLRHQTVCSADHHHRRNRRRRMVLRHNSQLQVHHMQVLQHRVPERHIRVHTVPGLRMLERPNIHKGLVRRRRAPRTCRSPNHNNCCHNRWRRACGRAVHR